MADYAETTWVDDDGSGTVGTRFTAARMNNIEDGITDGRVRQATFAEYLAAPYAPASSANKGWVVQISNVPVLGLYMSNGSAWVNIAAGPGVTPAYTNLFERQGKLPASALNNLHMMGTESAAAGNGAMLVNTGNVGDGSPSDYAPIYYDGGGYTVTGLTIALRLWVAVLVNGTAPAANFLFGLYPLTNAGGAGLLSYTAGTLVSGTSFTVTGPGASAWATGSGTPQQGIAAGRYVIGVTPSTTVAANSRVKCIALVQASYS